MSRVRVGTYNLYLGADLGLLLGQRSEDELEHHQRVVQQQLATTAFPQRVKAVARVLARERLDLVGLQEVCVWEADGAPLWDFAEELLRALEAEGTPYDVAATQPTFEGAGVMVVDGRSTRLRLEGSNAILRRRDSPVEVASTSVGLFESALAARVLGGMTVAISRGWCAARCIAPGGRGFTFAVTHTEAYDEESRDRQRDELLDVLPAAPEPVVLVGDLNARPDRVGMPEGFADAWVEAGNPSDAARSATCCQAADLTNPDSLLHDRIDYVWLRGLPVVEAHRFGADAGDRADGLWPSDHAGVAATLGV